MKKSRNTASPVLSGKRLVINFRLCEPFVLFVIAFLLSSFHLYCYRLPPPSYSFLSFLPLPFLPLLPPSPYSFLSFLPLPFLPPAFLPLLLLSSSFIPTSILRCYPVLLAGASMAQGYSDGHNRRFNHNYFY